MGHVGPNRITVDSLSPRPPAAVSATGSFSFFSLVWSLTRYVVYHQGIPLLRPELPLDYILQELTKGIGERHSYGIDRPTKTRPPTNQRGPSDRPSLNLFVSLA
ncbi:UNVERIFIED_CONTAM: hypothetical protein FKN15_000037 [Acipenser sinensis]